MNRRPPLRPYLVAWVPLAAVYAALFVAARTPWPAAIRGAIVSVLPFLLLGIPLLELPLRLPWRDGRRTGHLAILLALAVAYAVVGTAAVLALRSLDALLTTGSAHVQVQPLNLAWQALFGVLLCLVITGGAQAWHSAQRAREAADRAARAETLRAQAELAALRSQLNPHFLLNTLHAALGLVRRDPALAERALERLGDTLHYGLRMHRDGLDRVALADEWAFVESYLEIEKLRLEERLRLEAAPDPGTLACSVPPFVLQPLVENAIRHAVEPRQEGGSLAVGARLAGDRLVLEVRDDGPGVPGLLQQPGTGLGLQLLRDRLALLYGGAATLSLSDAVGGGTCARIELPAALDDDGAAT